jgi:miniconductance mechanosensitive channel
MRVKFLFDIKDILMGWGVNGSTALLINAVFGILIIILLAYFSDLISRKILVNVLTRFVKRSKTSWDDKLLERNVFTRIAHIAPGIVIYFLAGYMLPEFPVLLNWIQKVTILYLIIVILLSIDSLISGMNDIYETFPVSKNRSIKGYIQLIKILLYFVSFLIMISILFNQPVSGLITGLGAVAAILLLVFKDTILGFVASIQLSANDMVRIGDWITMKSHNADGTVTEITLNTVKVQNWDKTISTIPTYALVSESFSNWRGMEESGGRRIKRHINIDMRSVKFNTPEMNEKFKKIIYLKDYIEKRQMEIEQFNKENNIDSSITVNGRRMTNLGTFRKYLEMYLYHHPKIHNDLTFLVRQLQPYENGIPIEIYVFSNDQQWASYESIQADIFDHILAVIPEFELRVFQNPTGEDFKSLAGNN